MFEKKKLHDIKSLFLTFVTIELGFHTKAVEFFTKAYQEIADIDEDEDLEVCVILLFATLYIQGCNVNFEYRSNIIVNQIQMLKFVSFITLQ